MLSSPVKRLPLLWLCWKILSSFAALSREIFYQASKRNFVSPHGHVMTVLCILSPVKDKRCILRIDRTNVEIEVALRLRLCFPKKLITKWKVIFFFTREYFQDRMTKKGWCNVQLIMICQIHCWKWEKTKTILSCCCHHAVTLHRLVSPWYNIW